ncbi:MAG: cyclic nucleotide-binding domain-containing protein [Planctomycetota bacterium]|jgi:CRP-like cAMP-binding protein
MLELDDKIAALQKGIFSGLDHDTLAAMAGRMGERSLSDGEVLFLKGEPGDEIFVVVEGEIEIFIHDHSIALLGAGQLFGEMAVLGGGLRTASGRAKGTARLLFLKEKAIKLLIQQIPDLAFAIFKVLVERLEEANRLTMFLSEEQVALGTVKVVGGALAGEVYPIHHREAVLGRARFSAAADAFRIALPVEDDRLLEQHAHVSLQEGIAYIEPQDGEVCVNGEVIADCLALSDEDVIEVGGLSLKIEVHPV